MKTAVLDQQQYVLTAEGYRIVIMADTNQRGWGLSVEVGGQTQWRPITAGVNPLVRGRSFNLLASAVEQVSEDELALTGEGDAQGSTGAMRYPWSALVRLDRATGWTHVDVVLELPEAIQLRMVEGFEPEITLDLGPLPPYERGDHVWFKTLIANPTKWNDEAFGNDMPATYFCDPNGHYELMMFFDMTAMDWMGFDNIARFMNYRCGWRRRYRPGPAAEIGLYADGYSGLHLCAGEIRFSYMLQAAAREKPPTDQDALNELVERSLELLPTDTPWPQHATSWEDFANSCLDDLNHPACWRSDEHGEFILNYVNGHSPAWDEAIAARGQVCDMLHPCLDSALWLLRPLLPWQRLLPTAEKAAFVARLWGMIDRMLARDTLGMLRRPATHEIHGCWQYHYMLAELWHCARATERELVAQRVLEEIEQVTIPLARRCQYVFPLSFDRFTLEKSGSGDGHAIAGIYAELMLDLHAAYGNGAYRTEAEAALRTLYHLPVNSISQEVFMLAHGAHAAERLARGKADPFWSQCATYLHSQALRMLYWFNDRTTEDARVVNSLGTFQACCSIIYSALFENIEVLARLAPGLTTIENLEPVLRVYNLARKNNFYYFPACLPGQWHSSPLKFIPQENIPILEGPVPGKVGQEIYGAGWTFRAHLLWDAWGQVADRDLMLLNLNSYEEDAAFDHAEALLFVLYNPLEQPREARVTFTLPPGWSGAVCHTQDGRSFSVAPGAQSVVLALAAGAWLRLTLRANAA